MSRPNQVTSRLVKTVAMLFFASVWCIQSSFVLAQPPTCPPFFNIAENYKWTKNSIVKLRIHSEFTPDERGWILQAFDNWNSHRINNCSGVTFDTYPGNIVVAPAQTTIESELPNTHWVAFSPAIPTGYEALTGWSSRPSAHTTVFGKLRLPENSNAGWLVGVMMHEIGHSFRLADAPYGCSSVMGTFAHADRSITDFDDAKVAYQYCPPPPTPTPTPHPPPQGCNVCSNQDASESEFGAIYCYEADYRTEQPPGCCSWYQQWQCGLNGGTWNPATCTCNTPIVIDVLGNNFNLTSAQDGVFFDMDANHSPRQVSWTAANSDDAWLVLDRNGDGAINNAKELFGDLTVQPIPQNGEGKNGFRALAVFDQFDRGGNGDGKISIADSIFSQLRLWQDINHNGVSEPNELNGLTQMGLSVIELDYKESGRRDEHNNWFRFRSKVFELDGYQYGRWAYDVFLQTNP